MNSVSTTSSIQNSAGSGLKNGRLTIAYLTPHIGTTVNRLRWTGVMDAAQAHGVNVLCFVGEYWKCHDFDKSANIIYELAYVPGIDVSFRAIFS